MAQYRILAVQFRPEHIEEYRDYEASCLSEALMMAERSDAGRANFTYGVLPEDFGLARVEGIDFNEANGLLYE